MTTDRLADSAPIVWQPSSDWRTSTRVGRFMDWLASERGVELETWDDLWTWSVTDLDGFWSAIWDHFEVRPSAPYSSVLEGRAMPGTRWFSGARLNYARHLLEGHASDERPAVLSYSQTREPRSLTFAELSAQVACLAASLRRLGVTPGDRVAGYLPNIPETLVAFLATASVGAVWTSCAPEFGARSVLDRLAQVEPKVLFVVGGYTYGDKPVDKSADISAVRAGLPSVEHLVEVPYGGSPVPGALAWPDLLEGEDEIPVFEEVEIDHPLCILFSSGTTGRPKAIVHGHGGILVEHLKNHALSWDLGADDRLLWFTTTSWMIWNSVVSALLVDCSIVMLDGNPVHPGVDWQWSLAAETGATVMGASPGFLMASRREGLHPAADHDLSALRELCAAGSPLAEEGYTWVLEEFGPRVLLNVGSGGTDVCSGILQGSPAQPVHLGEITAPCLAVATAAYDPEGHEVVGELGELVITEPMPSMPVTFWGEDGDEVYRSAYFDTYPGVWRHGDWIRFSPAGSSVIAGRSDATLNRGGVRLGTAEFYRVVEELPGVLDCLVVHLEDPAGGNGHLILAVELEAGRELQDAHRAEIATALRASLSPRHVPDLVVQVPSIPRTRTGKKLEVPAKRILQGEPLDQVADLQSLVDPQSLDAFVGLAGGLRAAGGRPGTR
ncbi:MAG: acetoacetate--CoA ligase [Nocardioides sp.]